MKRMKRTKGTTGNNGLTTRQLKIVEEVVRDTKVVEIARKLGLARSSIYNELKKPVVKQALEEMQWLLNQRSYQKAQELSSRALDKLEELIESENESTCLKACQVALKAGSGQTPTEPPKEPLPTFDLKGEDLTAEKIEEIQAKLMAQVVQGELGEEAYWQARNLLNHISYELNSEDSQPPKRTIRIY